MSRCPTCGRGPDERPRAWFWVWLVGFSTAWVEAGKPIVTFSDGSGWPEAPNMFTRGSGCWCAGPGNLVEMP